MSYGHAHNLHRRAELSAALAALVRGDRLSFARSCELHAWITKHAETGPEPTSVELAMVHAEIAKRAGRR